MVCSRSPIVLGDPGAGKRPLPALALIALFSSELARAEEEFVREYVRKARLRFCIASSPKIAYNRRLDDDSRKIFVSREQVSFCI